LASRGFVRNDRQSKFLRFVVEQQLQGKASELKESLVGIEVFGRTPGFDPRQDSIVRTEAARLRARLSEYYAAEGAADPIVIELPKGGYTPVFREPGPAAGVEVAPAVAKPPASRHGIPSWLALALAGAALVFVVSGWWWATHKGGPIAIAVLPLLNQSEDPANDYIADGLTSEIIRNLSIIEGLAVRSQTSSFTFKGKPPNIGEAGKQLNAEYILEGSVLRSGEQLRINAMLVRVRDDTPVWSARIERESTNIVTVQDEISRGIVNSLRLQLGRGRRRYETSAEAYDSYLRARALETRGELAWARESILPYTQAIAKDPSFAPAYAGLAMAYTIRLAISNTPEDRARMRATADKALQLDPLLGEAHEAMGMAYARAGQWEQSEAAFRRAIELDAGRSMSRVHYALNLIFPLGRVAESVQQLRLAERADPLSPEVRFNLAYLLTAAGRFDEAAGHCERLSPDHTFKSQCLGRARLGQGRTAEAIEIFADAVNRGVAVGDPAQGWLGLAYGRAGRRDEAERLAAVLSDNAFLQTLVFAGMGDADRAFESLDRMAELGPVRIGRVLALPELALLRGDPRREALRKRVGLPQ
jgi:TolB-like protein/Tfp pilus assembly protein PilF